MSDYKEVFLGDLIIYSEYSKGNKIYFDIETFKKFYADDIEQSGQNVDYEKVFDLMSAVFKEASGGKLQLNSKTEDYEPIILRLFLEKIKAQQEKVDWWIRESGRGVLPSEKFLPPPNKKSKGGVLGIRIPDEDGWVFDVLEKESEKIYGKKNKKSLYALTILKEALKPWRSK